MIRIELQEPLTIREETGGVTSVRAVMGVGATGATGPTGPAGVADDAGITAIDANPASALRVQQDLRHSATYVDKTLAAGRRRAKIGTQTTELGVFRLATQDTTADYGMVSRAGIFDGTLDSVLQVGFNLNDDQTPQDVTKPQMWVQWESDYDLGPAGGDVHKSEWFTVWVPAGDDGSHQFRVYNYTVEHDTHYVDAGVNADLFTVGGPMSALGVATRALLTLDGNEGTYGLGTLTQPLVVNANASETRSLLDINKGGTLLYRFAADGAFSIQAGGSLGTPSLSVSNMAVGIDKQRGGVDKYMEYMPNATEIVRRDIVNGHSWESYYPTGAGQDNGHLTLRTRIYQAAPATADNDWLVNNTMTTWLNEASNLLTFVVKTSGGVVKTGTVAVA